MNTALNDNRILDCGHKPSPHSSCATGTAHWEGQEVCWDCSHARERELMRETGRVFAYLSGDGATITDWPGRELAKVTRVYSRRVGFGGKRYYIRAIAFDGSQWYGTGAGAGMYCRLRRCKT